MAKTLWPACRCHLCRRGAFEICADRAQSEHSGALARLAAYPGEPGAVVEAPKPTREALAKESTAAHEAQALAHERLMMMRRALADVEREWTEACARVEAARRALAEHYERRS